MADGDLLLIFRSFSTEDLQEKKETLLTQMTTLSSQTVGGKSLTRDLRHFKDQLAAIVFVLNERSLPHGYDGVGITDFSGSGSAPPAGTLEAMT